MANKTTGNAILDDLFEQSRELAKSYMGALNARDKAETRVLNLEQEMADTSDSSKLFNFDAIKRYTTLLGYLEAINDRCEELAAKLKSFNAEISAYAKEHGINEKDLYYVENEETLKNDHDRLSPEKEREMEEMFKNEE